MLFVGIDPGKDGAIAVLDDEGQVRELIPTPMIPGPVVVGKGGKKHRGPEDYDLNAIALFLRARVDRTRSDRGLFVVVERLDVLPSKRARFKGGPLEAMGGTKANFNRGASRGFAWMLAAFMIPHALVRPQEWQRALLHGMPGADPKAKSIAAAKQRWPSLDLRRTPASRNDDDGKTDALWLAEYGRTKRAGGPVFVNASGTVFVPDTKR